MERTKSEIQDPGLFEPNFEKEPLAIAAQVADLEEFPELKGLASEIEGKLFQSGSDVLYRWKNMPVALPPSIIAIGEEIESNIADGKAEINYGALFIPPKVDELNKLATDSSGRPKKLSQKQLDSIRRTGKFEVESALFKGQYHVWALNRIIQKGYEVSNKQFYSALSIALRLMIVNAKNRFVGNFFSVRNGFKNWRIQMTRLLDLLIGLKSMKQVPYQARLMEELHKHLMQELTVEPSEKEKYAEFCKQIRLALDDGNLEHDYPNAQVPYFYLTPDEIKIDFRLIDTELIESLDPVINEIMKNSEDHLVYLKELRNASVTQLKNDGLSDEEVAKNTLDMLEREYTKRVLGDIKNDQRLERISPGIGQLLCDQYRAVTIVDQACQELSQELAQHLKNYEEKLKKEHRVRSLIHEWVSQRIDEEKRAFIESHQYTAFERSLKSLGSAGLLQFKYLIERELDYLQHKKPELLKVYLKEKKPAHEFTFNRALWFPSNWTVQKTIIRNKVMGIRVIRSVQYHNDTSAPFWRWTNCFKRIFAHVSNLIYQFCISVPFNSTLSYRALFTISPFYPKKTVNSKCELIEDKKMPVLTFASRIKAIWENVKSSRAKFEQAPDQGLLGKSVSRVFNRAWNHAFKGAIGTLALSVVFPPLCLVVSTLSVVLGLTAPLWYPVLNLVLHIIIVLFIFDFDTVDKTRPNRARKLFPLPAIVFKLLFGGILQPALALATAVVLCPISSISITLIALVIRLMEKFYDDLIYHTILKRSARIPSKDTFVAKKIAGPALASGYFYQIKPEQALATVEAHLEIEILMAYMKRIETRLNEPIRLYSKYFDTFLKRFGYELNDNAEPISSLNDQVSSKIEEYWELVNKRSAYINRYKTTVDLSKMRLNENHLKILMAKSTELVEKHFTESILPYKNQTKADLFAEKGINDDDWTTFTGTILEEIFGSGILTPLEETHKYFSLKVDHLNLEKYTRMIADSELRDDLDKVHTVYQPKRGHVPIDLPQSLEISKFHPTTKMNPQDSLSIPVVKLDANLPNPTEIEFDAALIAIITHNHKQLEPRIDYTFEKVMNL